MDAISQTTNLDVESKTQYPFSFTGSGGEYFKIWIVNILLTILTLYIYSAWAKVRTKRYFYGNTVLDSSSFEYHAKPLQILLSRLVAAVLFVVAIFGQNLFPYASLVIFALIFLIIPWAIWRSTKFNARMTSYRNVRFGFDGKVGPLYLYMFLIPLIGYAVGGLAYYLGTQILPSVPVAIALVVFVLLFNIFIGVFTQQRLYTYFSKHYLYGKARFDGQFSIGAFVKIYAIATVLGLITLAAFAIIAFVAVMPEGMTLQSLLQTLPELQNGEADEAKKAVAMLMIKALGAFYLFLFTVGFLLAAFVSAKVRNYVYANLALDKRVTFESDVPVIGLWWVMFSNLLLIVITLGIGMPFAKVRMARFMAKHTKAISATPLDQFVGEKRAEVGAFGDELGDAFDMDMDVGF